MARRTRTACEIHESNASADPSALSEVTSNDGLLSGEDGTGEGARGAEGGPNANGDAAHGATTYKVYKRRWFGLFQLALLNIIVSWDVSDCFCLGPRLRYYGTDMAVTVALLCGPQYHFISILQRVDKRHKLAELELSVLVRCCLTFYNFDPAPRRTSPSYHNRICLTALRELDSIWGHEGE